MLFGRRANLRVPVASHVEWSVRGARANTASVTKDWSRGGLFIRTDAPRPPGEVISILMELGGGAVRIEGTVVHRSREGMGIRLDVAGARVV
ncbi:MAG: PilZ domain-containing protein [Myxococcota bacterium]